MFQLNFPAELKVADTITFCKGSFFVVWSNIGTLQSTSYNQCIAKRSSRKLFEICYVFLSPKKFKFTTWMVMMFCFGSIWCRFLTWHLIEVRIQIHQGTTDLLFNILLTTCQKAGVNRKSHGPRPWFSCVIARIDVLLYSHNMILLAKSGIQRLGVCVCVTRGENLQKASPRFRCFVFNFSPTCHWVQLIRSHVFLHNIFSCDRFGGALPRPYRKDVDVDGVNMSVGGKRHLLTSLEQGQIFGWLCLKPHKNGVFLHKWWAHE